MKDTRLIMGMPITVEIADAAADSAALEEVFAYFIYIDDKFSTYKATSEISQINRGELTVDQYSPDMKTVLALSAQTKLETDGYFDISHHGQLDPSGLVKGWAIYNAAELLRARGLKNFFVEAGGDIEARGQNSQGRPWRVGIRNPFNLAEIVQVVRLSNQGLATSGTYIRGQHVYNPKADEPLLDIVSLSVIGPNVYEADRFATAVLAMGKAGIEFIAQRPDLAGYAIDADGLATYTNNFKL